MKHVIALIFFVILSLSAKSEERVATAPKITVGSYYVYDDFDDLKGKVNKPFYQKVTAVKGDTVEVGASVVSDENEQPSNLDPLIFDRSWNQTERSDRTFNPHTQVFKFPVRAGECWKGGYVVQFKHGPRRIEFDGQTCAVGWEKITVTGKEYETLKFEFKGTFANKNSVKTASGNVTMTAYHSMDVGRFVRFTYDDGWSKSRSDLRKYVLAQ